MWTRFRYIPKGETGLSILLAWSKNGWDGFGSKFLVTGVYFLQQFPDCPFFVFSRMCILVLVSVVSYYFEHNHAQPFISSHLIIFQQ